MKTILFIFLTVTVSISGFTQTSNGKIVGKLIENSSSKAISSETILLYKDDVQFASARSGSGGNFSFVSVETGDYALKVVKPGYQSYYKKIRINPNFTTKIVIAIEPTIQEKETKSSSQNVAEKRSVETRPKTEITLASSQKIEGKEIPVIEIQVSSEEKTATAEGTEPELIAIEPNNEPVFYDAVEEMPEPLDGWAVLMKNIVYPPDASKLNIQGTVYLQAFISKEGEVTNIVVMKSIPMLDLSAQEAVYKTKFKPGVIGGEIVNSKLTIPVPFKLRR